MTTSNMTLRLLYDALGALVTTLVWVTLALLLMAGCVTTHGSTATCEAEITRPFGIDYWMPGVRGEQVETTGCQFTVEG